jgi:CheY-like chemotaxis protein
MPSRIASKAKPQPRILLVDDNRSGLAARRVLLEELGYEIVAVSQPREAVRRFEEAFEAGTPFQVLVTDFRMPELDGVELILRLRAVAPDLPAILVSGYVDALGLTERSTGANMVIMKSANEVQHLLRAVKRYASSRAVRKPPRSEPSPPRAARKRASGQ